MRVEGNILYADEGKVLDFKNPRYALDGDNVVTEVHLYSPTLRMSSIDSPDNYIEIDINEVE